MILKPSIHYNDACNQVASNSTLYSNATQHILTLGVRKWDIVKTLVYIMPNGLHCPVWLDSEGRYVYRNLGTIAGNYPVIGELEYTEDPIEFDYEE